MKAKKYRHVTLEQQESRAVSKTVTQWEACLSEYNHMTISLHFLFLFLAEFQHGHPRIQEPVRFFGSNNRQTFGFRRCPCSYQHILVGISKNFSCTQSALVDFRGARFSCNHPGTVLGSAMSNNRFAFRTTYAFRHRFCNSHFFFA